MRLELSPQILEKYSNMEFHQNPSSASRVIPWGRTDSRHDEANGRFSQFCKRAYRGADKSLARPTSRCILFDGENISFDASLVLYLYIYIYK